MTRRRVGEAQWLRVGHFNVRGLRSREVAVRELFEREQLHVLTLVETFLDREQGVQLGGELVALCNERAGTRAPGGTAVLIRHGIEFKRMDTKLFDKTEVVVVRVARSTVGALYCPPHARWEGLRQALEFFCNTATGKAILLGDFNGRHHSWCSASNARGRKLNDWAQHRRWSVCAPPQTTCSNSCGSRTTIDFALVRAGSVRRVTERRDWREYFTDSDHAPVTLEWWGRVTELRKNDRRIPKGRRKEEGIVAVAHEWSKQELPWHTQRLKEASTQAELDIAYDAAVQCLLRPWNRARAKDRPARWGFFWTRELQRLTHLRKKLWQRWKKQGEKSAGVRIRRLTRR